MADRTAPTELGHIPVLRRQIAEVLSLRAGETYLDCTAGLGGHAVDAAAVLGPEGLVILNDLDSTNLARAAASVRAAPNPPRVIEWHGNYAEAPRRAAALGLRADAVLADLGFSSNQVDDPSRGLSFSRAGPLDMRLDPSQGANAAELVNRLSENELAEIIRDLGEERQWRRITQRIVQERARSPISTTEQLADIVRSAAGRAKDQRIDPATRTFQALRIAVNDELGSLRSLLESVSRAATLARSNAAATPWLAPGARFAVVSFHSLEDRLVKETFRELITRGLAEPLVDRPLEADEGEVRSNPRSRSAKLRAIRLRVENPGAPVRVV